MFEVVCGRQRCAIFVHVRFLSDFGIFSRMSLTLCLARSHSSVLPCDEDDRKRSRACEQIIYGSASASKRRRRRRRRRRRVDPLMLLPMPQPPHIGRRWVVFYGGAARRAVLVLVHIIN